MADEKKNEQQRQGEQRQGGTVKIANFHRATVGLPPVHHQAKEGYPPQLKHGEHVLTPGDNTVSAEHWAAIKGHPVIKNMLEQGLIREGEMPRAEQQNQTARESLDRVPDEQAMHFVNSSTDRDQLIKWQQTEKRSHIRDAINRRIEALGQGTK